MNLLSIGVVIITFTVASCSSSKYECGKLLYKTGYTAGGVEASKGEAPWKVALLSKRDGQYFYFCGGVLVNNDTIITAAHCLHNKGESNKIRDENILVLLGSHNLLEIEEERLSRNISFSIIHKDWNPHIRSFIGDIAALKLSQTVNYTDSINPICLYDQLNDGKLLSNASRGVIYGWGKNESQLLQSTPYKVEVPISDVYNCKSENPYISDLVWNESICAGELGKGACLGDSGSALLVNVNDRYYLRGIVSSSEAGGCGNTTEAIYADAVSYQSFIDEAKQSKELVVEIEYFEDKVINGYPLRNVSILNTTTLPKNYNGEPITDFKVQTKVDFTETFIIALKENFNKIPNFKEGLIKSKYPTLEILAIMGIGKMNTTADFRRKHLRPLAEIRDMAIANLTISNFEEDLFFEMVNLITFQLIDVDHSSKLNIAKSFKNAKRLIELSITNCETLFIPEQPMKNNETIKRLELPQNKITNLPEIFFQSLGNVKFLVLSDNLITEIPTGLFSKCIELFHLRLSNNQIEIIRRGTFKNTKKLEWLYLNNNNLKRIEQRFDKIEKLNNLYLDNNPCVDLYFDEKKKIKENSKNITNMCKVVVPDYDD